MLNDKAMTKALPLLLESLVSGKLINPLNQPDFFWLLTIVFVLAACLIPSTLIGNTFYKQFWCKLTKITLGQSYSKQRQER